MGQQSGCLYEFDGYSLNAVRRVLLHGGDPVPLTPKAFATLLVLVRNGDRAVSQDELLREVWPGTFVEEATITQNVFTLRKALGQQPNGDQ